MKKGVLLLTHGTVDSLAELPSFLTKIRRGHAPPPNLVDDVRRRYEAIGGRSPLHEITARLAERVATKLELPTRFAARFSEPSVDGALAALLTEGVTRVALVPLAQFSSAIYCGHAVERAAELGVRGVEFVPVANWGAHDRLHDAFVRRGRAALASIGGAARTARLLVTAHALPVRVIRGGDPYEREFRAAAERYICALAADVGSSRIAFQSQGQSAAADGRPVDWLGPDLASVIGEARAGGITKLVVAPIGFLADHVEILYDIDIEAARLAREGGMNLVRTASLNDDDDFVDLVAELARNALGDA